MITLINIEKSFNENKVIHNFSYTFSKGKIYAITGPSGSGKSTLLNIIGLLETPSKGKLTIFNKNNVKLNSYKSMLLLRNKISYLFQNYALIEEETVFQNLSIALEYLKQKNTEKKEQIIQILKLVDLENFEHRKISELSGGEQQRVAMARVLLKPSELVLADEPTGNLDKANRDKIFNLFIKLKMMGKCVIIASHDEQIINRCDEIIELKKHKLEKI